jgi:hypothetical protein
MAPFATETLPIPVRRPQVGLIRTGMEYHVLVAGGWNHYLGAPYAQAATRIFHERGGYTDAPDRPSVCGLGSMQNMHADTLSTCDLISVSSQGGSEQEVSFRFDASSSTWVAIADLPFDGESEWAAFGLPGGMALAYAQSEYDENGSYLWDPVADTWTAVAMPLMEVRDYTISARLSDGRVLAIDFQGTTVRWSVFDPGTLTWSAVSSFTASAGLSGNSWALAPLDAGRALLVFRTPGSAMLAYRFDGSATWSATGAPSVVRQTFALAGSYAGEAFLVGGTTAPDVCTTSIERYDAAAGTWAAWDTLPTAASEVAVIITPSYTKSRLYCIGGTVSGVNPPTDQVAIYEVAAAYAEDWPCVECDCGGGEITPPVVNNPVPAVGTRVASSGSVQFDTTDDTGLRRVVVMASFRDGGADEVVHDGNSFRSPYDGSTRSAITGGFRYTVVRRGGWRGRSVKLRTVAIDTSGNEP